MVLKEFLLILCGILLGVTIIPPQPPVKSAIVLYQGQPIEYIIRGLAYFAVTVFTAAFSYYTVTVISLSSLPRLGHVVPYVCPAGPAVAASLTSYSLRFIAGVTLVVLGAILRLLSFRSLGTLFTFEVAITEEHRLITSGPYAYTRHPSYTGVVFLLLGVQFIHFGLGGYVSTCDIVSTPAGFLIYVWWFCLFFVPLSLLRRCDVEDAQLHRHFGDAWLRYKKEVPYRLLPLLY